MNVTTEGRSDYFLFLQEQIKDIIISGSPLSICGSQSFRPESGVPSRK
jgi:hypothetical protein